MGLESLHSGDLPGIADSYSGRCIVACSAKSLWSDLERLGQTDGDVLCVNDAGIRFPGEIEHWYSSHAELLKAYRQARVINGPNHTHSIAASRMPGEADWQWPWPGHGDSGLNAIYTALGLGYDEVIVCGLAQDNSGHFYDPLPGHWLEARAVRGKWTWYGDRRNYKVWKRAIEHVFDGRVRFMSGRFA